MKTGNAGFSRDEAYSLASFTILVLGSGTFWTRQTFSLIESEFDLRCLRVGTTERARDLAPGLSGLRLVIVDEQFTEDLVARPEDFFGIAPDATVALAYRDVDTARDVDRRYDGAHGPMGYLPMRVPIDVWLSELRLLLHRERFLPGDLRPRCEAREAHAEKVLELAASDDDAGSRIQCLTDREREVLILASVGNSNKSISRKLDISEHTVKLHMHHVYAKLGVSNRTAAASLLRMEDTAQ